MSAADSSSARTKARELIVQALYQMQIAGHDTAELVDQFRARPDYNQVDKTYFDELLPDICQKRPEMEANLDAYADRPVQQLDPVELGILLLGLYELRYRSDVPPKVVINESINLAKRFGAVDAHKYVNAVLDKAAADYRAPA